jgi:hypothetical protein
MSNPVTLDEVYRQMIADIGGTEPDDNTLRALLLALGLAIAEAGGGGGAGQYAQVAVPGTPQQVGAGANPLIFPFYPETYGAKGDGTTDDTTAIQNCINASTTAVTNISYVLAEVQFRAASYVVTGLTAPPGLVMRGVNAQGYENATTVVPNPNTQTQLLLKSGSTSPILVPNDGGSVKASHVRIYDIAFNGNQVALGSGGAVGTCINLPSQGGSTSRFWIVERCYLFNAGGTGSDNSCAMYVGNQNAACTLRDTVLFNGTSGSAAGTNGLVWYGSDGRVENCFIGYFAGTGFFALGGTSEETFYWNGGGIFTCNINVEIGGGGFSFSDMSVDHSATDGVYINDGPVTFHNCVFGDNSLSANHTYSNIHVAGNNVVLNLTDCHAEPLTQGSNNPAYMYNVTGTGCTVNEFGNINNGVTFGTGWCRAYSGQNPFPTAPNATALSDNTISANTAYVDTAVAVLASEFLPNVVPSGDTTGVADAVSWNAALASHHYIKGIPGSTYYISEPVYMLSHSELDMTGCTIIQPTGTFANVLSNFSAQPTRTTTDAAATANSATLTSATGFTSADDNAAVQVVGAAYGGACWYGRLPASASGTTATVTTPTYNGSPVNNVADVTVSGKTMYVYATRDKDITIRGGTWQFCDQSSASNPTPLNQQPTCFRRIDGLRIYDVIYTQAGTQGIGGRIIWSAADCTDVHWANWHCGVCASGSQCDAPMFNCTIENISGIAGDDMIALSTQDDTAAGSGGGNYLRDTQGNIGGVTVRNITGTSNGTTPCWNTFKLYDLGNAGGAGSPQASKFSFSQVTVDGIHGVVSSNGEGVYLVGQAASQMVLTDVVIRNVDVVAGNALNPLVSLLSTDRMSSILIENIVWSSSAVNSSLGMVSIVDPRGAITVRNLKFNSSVGGTNYGLYISNSVGPLSGSTWGSAITLDGVYCGNGQGAAPANFNPVFFAGSSAGTLPKLSLHNIYCAPTTSGNVVRSPNNVALPDLNMSDIKCANMTALVSVGIGTNAVVARLSNVSFAGANLCVVSCPFTLEMANVDVNTSGAVVAITNADATPVTISAVNYTQAGAGVLYTIDGAQVVTVTGVPLGGQLASTYSCTNSFATFLTSSTLGIGYWLVTLGYSSVSSVSADQLAVQAIAGTATYSVIGGQTYVVSTFTGTGFTSEQVPGSLTFAINVTAPGTVVFQAKIGTGGTASIYGNNVDTGITGWTATPLGPGA